MYTPKRHIREYIISSETLLTILKTSIADITETSLIMDVDFNIRRGGISFIINDPSFPSIREGDDPPATIAY
jgi:hypothetical protein